MCACVRSVCLTPRPFLPCNPALRDNPVHLVRLLAEAFGVLITAGFHADSRQQPHPTWCVTRLNLSFFCHHSSQFSLHPRLSFPWSRIPPERTLTGCLYTPPAEPVNVCAQGWATTALLPARMVTGYIMRMNLSLRAYSLKKQKEKQK